tara:strand:- start:33844 stop:35232 length:1389 start_codon:yes stop_codon:yes gene_type:complete
MKKVNEKFAFIAGSALLDIVSTITEFRHIEDNIGMTTLNFGGVAYNVAVNLRRLNVPTTLCTAMNNSPISQMIMNELTRQHVRTYFKIDKSLPDGIYNGMFYEGKEVASVWVNTVEKVVFDKAFIRKGMQNAACLLITSCMTIKNMNKFIQVANDLNIPVFVGGASLMEVSKLKDIEGKVDYYFINANEMDKLTRAVERANSWCDTAVMLNATFIVTKGGEGAEICTPDGDEKVYKTKNENVSGNVLGAGDLFMSMAIKEILFEGASLDNAIAKSMNAAVEILQRDDANIGTPSPLAANIQMVADRAHHDKLTGALNRHGVERYLTAPDAVIENMHMLLIDADFFKNINDTYGHNIGDEALVSIVQVVKDLVRQNDLVARFGGEEFICLLNGMTNAQAEKIAERMRVSIDCQNHTSADISMTVSIGVCKWGKGENLEGVLKRADDALYQAKLTGRNKVVWAK